jgi:DNA-binding transcriptional regulator YiaG
MEKIYQDEMAMVCHQVMQAAFDIGAISKEEMRKFDKSCLISTPKQEQQTERTVRIVPVSGQARA